MSWRNDFLLNASYNSSSSSSSSSSSRSRSIEEGEYDEYMDEEFSAGSSCYDSDAYSNGFLSTIWEESTQANTTINGDDNASRNLLDLSMNTSQKSLCITETCGDGDDRRQKPTITNCIITDPFDVTMNDSANRDLWKSLTSLTTGEEVHCLSDDEYTFETLDSDFMRDKPRRRWSSEYSFESLTTTDGDNSLLSLSERQNNNAVLVVAASTQQLSQPSTTTTDKNQSMTTNESGTPKTSHKSLLQTTTTANNTTGGATRRSYSSIDSTESDSTTSLIEPFNAPTLRTRVGSSSSLLSRSSSGSKTDGTILAKVVSAYFAPTSDTFEDYKKESDHSNQSKSSKRERSLLAAPAVPIRKNSFVGLDDDLYDSENDNHDGEHNDHHDDHHEDLHEDCHYNDLPPIPRINGPSRTPPQSPPRQRSWEDSHAPIQIPGKAVRRRSIEKTSMALEIPVRQRSLESEGDLNVKEPSSDLDVVNSRDEEPSMTLEMPIRQRSLESDRDGPKCSEVLIPLDVTQTHEEHQSIVLEMPQRQKSLEADGETEQQERICTTTNVVHTQDKESVEVITNDVSGPIKVVDCKNSKNRLCPEERPADSIPREVQGRMDDDAHLILEEHLIKMQQNGPMTGKNLPSSNMQRRKLKYEMARNILSPRIEKMKKLATAPNEDSGMFLPTSPSPIAKGAVGTKTEMPPPPPPPPPSEQQQLPLRSTADSNGSTAIKDTTKSSNLLLIRRLQHRDAKRIRIQAKMQKVEERLNTIRDFIVDSDGATDKDLVLSDKTTSTLLTESTSTASCLSDSSEFSFHNSMHGSFHNSNGNFRDLSPSRSTHRSVSMTGNVVEGMPCGVGVCSALLSPSPIRSKAYIFKSPIMREPETIQEDGDRSIHSASSSATSSIDSKGRKGGLAKGLQRSKERLQNLFRSSSNESKRSTR